MQKAATFFRLAVTVRHFLHQEHPLTNGPIGNVLPVAINFLPSGSFLDGARDILNFSRSVFHKCFNQIFSALFASEELHYIPKVISWLSALAVRGD